MKKPYKKMLAMLLTATLLLTGLPMAAIAEGGGCNHHAHDDTCGYVHAHDENCG